MRLPRLMHIKEVMVTTGLGRSTIYKKIKEGTFPPPLHISPGCVRWNDKDIIKWIYELTNQSSKILLK
ncbi:AlpA family phage regulatory protein [Ochrobactrum sp. MR28]|nr:AlpA family phage regulatory protein [Ochrobactrum sp. MR28]MBX8817980.1 AlpA family phage regulatory protein [Ochrobactrum sp. MR31]